MDFSTYKFIILPIIIIIIIALIILFKIKYKFKIIYKVYYPETYEEELNKEYHEKKTKELKKQVIKENEEFKQKQQETIQERQEVTNISFAIPIGKWTKLIFGEKVNNIRAIKNLIRKNIKNKKKIGIWQIKIEANKQLETGKNRGKGR